MTNFSIIALVLSWYGDCGKNEIIYEYFEFLFFVHTNYFGKLIPF